jgi:hypothetical protein
MAEPQVLAAFDYIGVDSSQLSFRAGDSITILDSNTADDWWFGKCSGQEGWFPKSYVKPRAKPRPLPTPPSSRAASALNPSDASPTAVSSGTVASSKKSGDNVSSNPVAAAAREPALGSSTAIASNLPATTVTGAAGAGAGAGVSRRSVEASVTLRSPVVSDVIAAATVTSKPVVNQQYLSTDCVYDNSPRGAIVREVVQMEEEYVFLLKIFKEVCISARSRRSVHF